MHIVQFLASLSSAINIAGVKSRFAKTDETILPPDRIPTATWFAVTRFFRFFIRRDTRCFNFCSTVDGVPLIGSLITGFRVCAYKL